MNKSSFVSAVTALSLLATPALAAEGGASEPLLLLEDALALARGQNHGLAASELELERQEERSAVVVTRRFPTLRFDAIGNRLLKSMDFPLNAGVFGTFEGIGPVPATDTSVSVPTGFSGTVSASIAQLTLLGTYARNFNYQVLPKEILTVGLWLSWEPFDWGRRGHEAREQKLAADKARQGRQETQEQVEVEVGQRWRAVKDATGRLEAARLSEEAAKAYLGDLQNKYREDATLLNDVLEAEARLSRARHDFTDALAGYWSENAGLERTIGDENS